MRRLGLALALAAVVLPPAASAAGPTAERYVPMRVPPGPGPAKYDRVFVLKLIPTGETRNVLVLVPGTNGGAGGVLPVAREIVRGVPRTQVWIVDRRQQAFEDTSVFEGGDPQQAQDYYLGFKYRRMDGADAKFVANWGLGLQLADLRSVIRGARGSRGGASSSAGTPPAPPPRWHTRPGTSAAGPATATSTGSC